MRVAATGDAECHDGWLFSAHVNGLLENTPRSGGILVLGYLFAVTDSAACFPLGLAASEDFIANL